MKVVRRLRGGVSGHMNVLCKITSVGSYLKGKMKEDVRGRIKRELAGVKRAWRV